MKDWLSKLRYSLAARLMLLFLAAGIFILFVLNITIGFALKHQFDRNLRPHLTQYLHYVQRELGDPPDRERARRLAERAGIEIYIRGPEMNWSSGNGDLDLAEIRFRRPRHGPTVNTPMRAFAIGDYRDRLVLRTRLGRHVAFLSIPKQSGPRHALWVVLAAMAGVLAALYTMYRLIRRLFRPVHVINDAVRRFGAGDLQQRIPIDRKDELGDLGRSINAMADEIQRMLEAKRQLLLSVSHELRTPITRARVSTELLENSALKQNLINDLGEMEALISEILETERLNSGHAILNRTPVSLRQLVDEVLEMHFPGAGIRTRLPEGDDYVMLDASRIKLLIVNLLSNAVRHSRGAQRGPELSVKTGQRSVCIRVRDHGEGIPPQDLGHVTEPFFRADRSRQRRTGGYGLGLYLCRLIVEAHGGRLIVESRPRQGTTVSAQIPLENKESEPTGEAVSTGLCSTNER